MAFKEYWYHWSGLNEQIFRDLYLTHPSNAATQVINILHLTATFSKFPYWLAYFATCMAIGLAINLYNGADPWIHIKRSIVFIGAMALSSIITNHVVDYIKAYANMPRPYIALPGVHPLVTLEKGADALSFPSGHAAFAAFIVASIWVQIQGIFKLLAVAFVLAVCWSRVASGVHFPADVVWGALIAFVITVSIQGLVFKISHKIFRSESVHARRQRIH